MKKVNHKQIYKDGVFGGVTNTTLCGRVGAYADGYLNIDDKVTCKLCIKIMNTAWGKKIIKRSEDIQEK